MLARDARDAICLVWCALLVGGCGDDEESATAGGGTGGPSCVASTETCDGEDEDCDGVPDDGPCSEPAADGAWFLSGSGADTVRGVDFDDEGNVYVTGMVTFPAQLGAVSVEGAPAYIASLDPRGVVRWAYLWGASGSGYNYGQDLSVAGGVVCAGGGFSGPFDFGGGVRDSVGYTNAVVVCLDTADGTYEWDRAFGGELSDVIEGVRIAPSGDVVVTGSIEQGSADLGGGSIGEGYFVARYGTDGAFRWAHGYADSGADFSATPGIDAAENAYVIGRFHGAVDFGGGTRTPTGSGAAFVVALDADGGYVWDRTFEPYVNLYGADVQSTGGVVVCGDFTGPLSLGGPVVQAEYEGSLEAFAAGLDSSGAFAWQYRAGGVASAAEMTSTRAFTCAVGPGDEIVIAGEFAGTSVFGDVERTSAALTDMHAVGLTPDGKYRWDVVFGGSQQDAFNTVAISSEGRIALGGETWAEISIGADTHDSSAQQPPDAVLAFLR